MARFIAGCPRTVWRGVMMLFLSVSTGLGATRYVSPDGSHEAPYDTWAKAATNIQAAAAYADPGDLVLVTNGVYSAAGTGFILTIDKAITVRSVNGPEHTIIDALAGTTSTDRHCLWLTSTAGGALVAGFTMQGVLWNGTSTANSPVRIQAGTVSNCVIRANEVNGGVGGVNVNGGALVDSIVRDNRSKEWQQGRGGGVHLNAGTVERCLIDGNRTTTWIGGGGVYMTGGTLRNCVMAGNRADYFALNRDPAVYHSGGGGVMMTGGAVENCTIADNAALGAGAGLRASGGTVINSAIYHNTSSFRQPSRQWDVFTSGSATLSYCCTPHAVGTGNTVDPPEFRDRANGDYTLLPGSACIDAGTILGSFANDKDGTARPIGAAWDIGAYETPLPADVPFECNFTATPTEGFDAATVVFATHLAGANTNVTWYRWQFGDGAGVAGSSLAAATNDYAAGWFDVTLSVSNALGETATRTKAATIRVHPTVLYADPAGGHVFPYDTPARAATNIAAAVEAAYPSPAGTVVQVSDTNWAMATQISIEKDVTVRSANGDPTTCSISVPGQNRSFFLHHSNAVVEGFTLTTSSQGNPNMNGAGVYMIQGTVTNCIIRDIVIGGRGAAVWMAAGRLTHSAILNNETYEWQYGFGGGIYIEQYTHFGDAWVDNCRIENNETQSRWGGGGVYMHRGTLRNCLIVSNKATRAVAGTEGIGGGVRMIAGAIENCTLTRNHAVSSGGGVYTDGAASIINSIAIFNTTDIAPDGERNLYNAAGTVAYSCIAPLPAGPGNTAIDPLFRDADALDFRLQGASPCVDQGLNQAWMTDATDLDGNPRIQNGAVDMGCYEAPDPSAGPLIAGFSATPTVGFLAAQVVFTAEPVGLDTTIVHYAWTFGDGKTAAGSDRRVVTNTYAAGYYDVALVMENRGGEVATNTRAATIQIAPAVAYVATNGTSEAPYLSWETAAVTLQDALAAVGWDDAGGHTVVKVAPGTYGVGAPIALATNYTIIGAAPDAADVVMQGTAQARLFNISSPGVTLSGLTIAGGTNTSHLYDGGGIYMTAGLITNCIIRHNRAGGKGGGLYQTGGRVTHSTFFGNFASEHNYARGGGLYIEGGQAESCVFDANQCFSVYGGGGVYQTGGQVRNCLLLRNWADRSYATTSPGGGAVVAGGVFESCTVVTNWSIRDGGGIHMTGGAISNVIVVGNRVTDTGNPDWHNPLATVSYSCSPDLVHDPDGTGNITNLPVFVNADAHDFRLAYRSPGMDAGGNLAWMTDATDLAGNPRIARGIFQPSPVYRVDMGAYEYIPPDWGTIIFLR